MGDTVHGPLDTSSVPDVLVQQLVLHIPAEQCQCSSFRHKDTRTEWTIVLAYATRRCNLFRTWLRFPAIAKNHQGQSSLDSVIHIDYGHMGRWICLAKGLYSGRNYSQGVFEEGLDILGICGTDVPVYVLWLL